MDQRCAGSAACHGLSTLYVCLPCAACHGLSTLYVHVCLPCAALDLQSCGISTDGAVGFSEALRLNCFLVIVDLRDNELIGKFTQHTSLCSCSIHSCTYICMTFTSYCQQ